MQSDSGKLFVGGISWDTNEERLKEYFSAYGEVVEAIIMKDRTTGRARGFGFVVFADSAVADQVIKDKHNIDGRMVEAKRAVPRDDQNPVSRSPSVHSSPGPGRSKKIFVGGLASTVTETDFKKYFEQFGTVNDVVVMYDHNTQRPRGFGFITYDTEEAVDKVLLSTFHELNGKMVEVKRAIPKELSPGPTRSPLSGYNYGMNVNRLNSLFSGYNQGYAPSAVGGYPLRDGRFSPITASRSGFPPFGMSFEPSYEGNTNFSGNVSYARGMSPYYVGNPNRFNSNVGYDGGNGGSSSFFSSVTRNLWGNGGLTNSANSTNYTGSGTMSTGGSNYGGGGGGGGGINWGSSQIVGQGIGNNNSNETGNLVYGGGNNAYNLGTVGYGRNAGHSGGAVASSYGASNGAAYDGPLADLYGGGGSGYGDPTWRSSNPERGGSGSLSYGLGAAAGSDVPAKASPGYVGDYNVNKRVK